MCIITNHVHYVTKINQAFPILLGSVDHDSFHPVIFVNITSESIRAAALHTQGAAVLNALWWRWLCTATGQKSNDLCAALAAVAQIISTTFIDPCTLLSYTSCCLIPLDKCPGVRHIGIGEVVRSCEIWPARCSWYHPAMCRSRCWLRSSCSCYGTDSCWWWHWGNDPSRCI